MGIPYAEVIGDPIAHSKSPAIHKYWLQQLGLEGDYRATRVTADELPAFLAARRVDPDWRGCNVTMPLKAVVIPLLEEVTHSGAEAVNCIVPQEDGLRGINTDGAGIDEAIVDWDFGLEDSRICLIGAGGAARSAIAELDVYCYFTFDLVVRDQAKGCAFLKGCDVNGEVYPFERAGEAMAGRDAVINASPLGMTGFPTMPEPVLGGLGGVRRGGFVLDLVYSPLETALLACARQEKLLAIDGLTVLIGQAACAFERFFGVPAPREHDAELRELLTS